MKSIQVSVWSKGLLYLSLTVITMLHVPLLYAAGSEDLSVDPAIVIENTIKDNIDFQEDGVYIKYQIVDDARVVLEELKETIISDLDIRTEDIIFWGFIVYLALFAIGCIMNIVSGAVLLTFWGKPAVYIGEHAFKKMWTNMGMGLFISIVGPILSLMLASFVLTIPVAYLVGGLMTTIITVSQILAGMTIGSLLISIPKKCSYWRTFGILSLGTFLLYLLALIPIIGWIFYLLVLWITIGAIFQYMQEASAKLKKAKLL